MWRVNLVGLCHSLYDVLKGELPFTVSTEVGKSMKKKPEKKMLGPTLQLFELVPITDPAELEAIDRRRKAAEKAMAATARNSGKRKSPKRK